MAEHKHGSMDIRVQEKTYENFWKVTIRSVIFIGIALVVLAILGA